MTLLQVNNNITSHQKSIQILLTEKFKPAKNLGLPIIKMLLVQGGTTTS